MLSTRGLSAGTATVRIKSLDSRLAQDDQKDLEAETEEQSEELANGQQDVVTEEQFETEMESEQATHSGLSSRASDIREYLREETSVKAVLLKKDGSTEEITYDASSSGTRSLLGGRASIVGEIEDLKAVVVQSLEQSRGGTANQHTLPVPLCHNKGQSDYVLFRVDASGKAGDIAMEEYQKYVDAHKTLTATAVKQRNFDEEPIRSNSPFDASSELSMKSLRGALQTHFYDELTSAVDADPERNDAEIEEAVNEQLQKIVDDAVTAFTVSPMEDPDYDPAEEGLDEEAELEVVGSGYSLSTDDRPWRMQLDDALDHIKEVGKAHGEAFAERISATFYEVNGDEPTLEALSSLYDRIRTDFANEAEEELEDEEQSEAEAESEVESEEEMDFGDEWGDALDHVRSIGRKDGRCLAQNVCDLFNDVNGAEPTLSELHSVWQSIQDGLSAEALEQDLDEEGSSDDEEDEDAAYSPSNPIDSELASEDLAEDRKHDLEHFDQSMLNTPTVSSKRGGGVSWSVYFDESELNEEAESSNLVKSVEGFKMRNQREPNQVEVHKMKLFLSVPNELVDEEEAMADSAKMAKSAIVASEGGGGASWSVNFDDESSGSNLENAKRAFQRVHRREPTSLEQEQMRSFLAVPKGLDDRLEEQQSESTKARSPSKVLVSPVVAKKTAKRFNVYLEHSKLSQKESEQIAMKWFNRFNGRDPSKEERDQIHAFIQKEADLKEQRFLVPVQSLDFDRVHHDDDDAEEEEETDSVILTASTTKAVITKNAATGYTLSFDGDEKQHDGDKQEAIKWFKRFNQRNPDKEELAKIEMFMKAEQGGDEEDEDMLDIE